MNHPPGPPVPAGPPVSAGPPAEHPSANTALILGLIALAGSVLTCGLTLLLGPYAWYFGYRITHEINAAPHLGGHGKAVAGYAMGVVATMLALLGILFMGVSIVAWMSSAG